jgi:hypothetical protein
MVETSSRATPEPYAMTSSELDRFRGFAKRFLTDEQGHPLVIEEFQSEILADFFAGPR